MLKNRLNLPARMTSCCIEELKKNWLLMRRVQTSCARSQSRLSCNAWKPFCSQSRCQSYHRICIEPAKKIGYQVCRKFSWSIIKKNSKNSKFMYTIKNEKEFLWISCLKTYTSWSITCLCITFVSTWHLDVGRCGNITLLRTSYSYETFSNRTNEW